MVHLNWCPDPPMDPHSPGAKLDTGKLRPSLFPWESVNAVLEVLEYGAKKYSPEGWRQVPNANERYRDALLRHTIAMFSGEENDPESGLSHLAHIATNAFFLLAFKRGAK